MSVQAVSKRLALLGSGFGTVCFRGLNCLLLSVSGRLRCLVLSVSGRLRCLVLSVSGRLRCLVLSVSGRLRCLVLSVSGRLRCLVLSVSGRQRRLVLSVSGGNGQLAVSRWTTGQVGNCKNAVLQDGTVATSSPICLQTGMGTNLCGVYRRAVTTVAAQPSPVTVG